VIERIPITSRDQWLSLRRQDVTASTVGALFGAHPYVSQLALFKEKTGLELSETRNAMLEWRLLLEPVVAEAVARQRPDWTIVKATEYLRDPDARIGATPDFYIHGDPRGLGVLQAKTAAPASFKKQWTDDTPPFWVALQNATEMMLEEKAAFGAVACLIIDPWECNCPIYEIPRHAGVEARIREAVGKFWDDVAWGEEPAPDYSKDAELLAALCPDPVPLKTIDLSGDNHLPVLLAERSELMERLRTDESRRCEIDAEIKDKMDDAEIGVVDGYTIKFKREPRKAYSVGPTNPRVLRILPQRNKELFSDDGDF
jgi:predicted phage-related endonuclease